MRIGYARVSSDEQNLALQGDALAAVGCESVFEDDGVSGTAMRRPGLAKALAALDDGDALVVWRLDRLGRSLSHLVTLVADLQKRGCGFVSLTEAIDTTSATGKFNFHLFAALAEFERSLLIERTKAGMAAARRRGRHLGRPPALTGAQVQHARQQIASGAATVAGMAALLRVDPSTLRRALARDKSLPAMNLDAAP
jgi:DNA invertase Pin-like site-specific DNA recombinase